MTNINTLAVFVTAAMLATFAYLIELSAKLPEPLAHFTVALLAAVATLILVTRKSGSRSSASRPKATTASNSAKESGSVKWFSASKGFGFITRDNGEDIFVHFRSISGNGHRILREGQRVQFTVNEGSKGMQAEEVIAVK